MIINMGILVLPSVANNNDGPVASKPFLPIGAVAYMPFPNGNHADCAGLLGAFTAELAELSGAIA